MNARIRHILNQISILEDDLKNALHEQEKHLQYTIQGKRIEFEQAIQKTHHQLKVSVFRWLRTVPPQNFLTAPVIYSLIFPLLILDIWVTVYQTLCFPIYKIAKCRRQDYIRFDHQQLAYLNVIEKFHCLYCSYASGLAAYAQEITARTEQYFCPIKHAHKILSPHSRYARFMDYGEAENFHAKLKRIRDGLAEELKNSRPPAQ